MRCPTCGQENRSGATYCANCGASLPRPEPFDLHEEAQGAAETPPEPPDLSLGIPTVKLERPDRGDRPDRFDRPDREPEDAEPVTVEAEAEGAAGEVAEEPVEAPPAEGPLPVGYLIGGRFEVADVVEASPERNVYRARDWGRCAACGYDDNAKGDRFCLDCGAALDTPQWATVVEHPHRTPNAYDVSLTEAGREYLVAYEPQETTASGPEPAGAGPRLALRWGLATDAGLERDHNEDYAECWTFSQATGPQTGLFIVADGLGGQDAGEVASKMATLATWEVLRERIWQRVIGGERPDQDEVRQALLDAVGEANRTVYEARLQARNDMSTTITLALVVDEHAYIANVGDSRTYLFNSEGLRTITKDHSLVQRMVDTGQIQPSQVYSHPQRNLVYNTIGDRAEVNVDVFGHDLEPEDRLLLCSDGLWEMVRDEGIEEALMAESDPQRACDRLVRHANLAGGEDNISVIIVQALGRDGAPQAARPASGG